MIQIRKWDENHAVDLEGKRYVDLTAGGIFAAMFGPAWQGVKKAARLVDFHVCYAPHYGNYWNGRYKALICAVTGFESVAVFSTGSEATEAFWRVCRTQNGKPGVWGGLVDPDLVGSDKPQCDAFHGMTLGALIMAGRLTWPSLGIGPELGNGRFGMAAAATSCMIMEPYHAPSGQFHRIDPTILRVQSLQKEFPEIPLCLDEIQGGFGRTGKLFAYQHYGDLLRPDFVTIGKLCGGGFPLSALLGPKEIMETKDAHLHSTHSGNPLACAVGCLVIEEMQERGLVGRSAELGEKMHTALGTFPVRTHGKGLLAGLEFRDAEEASLVVKRCQERGLLTVDTGRKWVKIGPALTISERVLVKGVEILKEVVEEVVHERQAEAQRVDSPAREDGGNGQILSVVRTEGGEAGRGNMERQAPEDREDDGFALQSSSGAD